MGNTSKCTICTTTTHLFRKRLTKEINKLHSHNFKLAIGKSVCVRYEVYKTMFDGECVNSLVNNPATSRCPMCLCTTSQFNDTLDNFTQIEDNLFYGLGQLHRNK